MSDDNFTELDEASMRRIWYSQEYLDFLNSDKWRELAAIRREIDGHKCTMCGRPEEEGTVLDVHHLSYSASYQGGFGTEDIWKDLTSLCRQCHLRVHHMMMRRTSADGGRGWKSEYGVPVVNTTNMNESRWDL